MSETLSLLALFEDIDPAANAIDRLHEMGIENEKMEIISGIPIGHQILGRPKIETYIPRLALGGAFVGMIVALFLIFGIPKLFPLHVGGQPLLPFPPFYIVGFEMIMLGLMGTAFLGLFLAGRFPSYEKKEYVPEISDGKIAIVFNCPTPAEQTFVNAMQALGAISVKPVEATEL
jgi:hypothetical protein